MSQTLQFSLKSRRQFARKMQMLTGDRVTESQRRGVEQQARGGQQRAAGARVVAQIHRFSHERMPLLGQVDPDLVRPPGLQTHAAEGCRG